MVLQPTSMPPIIILGGGATKTDNIKVGNNVLKCFFFWFVQKKRALNHAYKKLESF